MEIQNGLIQLKNSEKLAITGGHNADGRHAGEEGLFTWHDVYDFARGVWVGYNHPDA